MLSKKEQSILDALEPRAMQEGCEIVTVEIVGSKRNPIIRVYLDTPEGITFDQVTEAQPWVDEIMERIDPFPGAYTLEVSTPGIDRPLRTIAHFQNAVGQEVTVIATEQIGGRGKFKGTLLRVEEDGRLSIEIDGQEYSVPFDMIKKAHVNGVVSFS